MSLWDETNLRWCSVGRRGRGGGCGVLSLCSNLSHRQVAHTGNSEHVLPPTRQQQCLNTRVSSQEWYTSMLLGVMAHVTCTSNLLNNFVCYICDLKLYLLHPTLRQTSHNTSLFYVAISTADIVQRRIISEYVNNVIC